MSGLGLIRCPVAPPLLGCIEFFIRRFDHFLRIGLPPARRRQADADGHLDVFAVSAILVTTVIFLFAAVFLLIINLLPLDFIPAKANGFPELFELGRQWRGWILLIILAAGPTLIGFGLYNVSLGMLPSSTANLILTLEPVITAITAYFLLDERLTALELIGSGMILGALILLRYRRTKRFS